jgi:cytochrome c551/c552
MDDQFSRNEHIAVRRNCKKPADYRQALPSRQGCMGSCQADIRLIGALKSVAQSVTLMMTANASDMYD